MRACHDCCMPFNAPQHAPTHDHTHSALHVAMHSFAPPLPLPVTHAPSVHAAAAPGHPCPGRTGGSDCRTAMIWQHPDLHPVCLHHHKEKSQGVRESGWRHRHTRHVIPLIGDGKMFWAVNGLCGEPCRQCSVPGRVEVMSGGLNIVITAHMVWIARYGGGALAGKQTLCCSACTHWFSWASIVSLDDESAWVLIWMVPYAWCHPALPGTHPP